MFAGPDEGQAQDTGLVSAANTGFRLVKLHKAAAPLLTEADIADSVGCAKSPCEALQLAQRRAILRTLRSYEAPGHAHFAAIHKPRRNFRPEPMPVPSLQCARPWHRQAPWPPPRRRGASAARSVFRRPAAPAARATTLAPTTGTRKERHARHTNSVSATKAVRLIPWCRDSHPDARNCRVHGRAPWTTGVTFAGPGAYSESVRKPAPRGPCRERR